jgi:hypothetical protein
MSDRSFHPLIVATIGGSTIFIASAITFNRNPTLRNLDTYGRVSGAIGAASFFTFWAQPQLISEFIREERFYNGFSLFIGAIGYCLVQEKISIEGIWSNGLGGFLIGYGSWGMLPSFVVDIWADRKTTCLDTFYAMLNASFVAGGASLLSIPAVTGRKLFGLSLIGISAFYLIPQKLRDIVRFGWRA